MIEWIRWFFTTDLPRPFALFLIVAILRLASHAALRALKSHSDTRPDKELLRIGADLALLALGISTVAAANPDSRLRKEIVQDPSDVFVCIVFLGLLYLFVYCCYLKLQDARLEEMFFARWRELLLLILTFLVGSILLILATVVCVPVP